MTDEEFAAWLEGFIAGCGGELEPEDADKLLAKIREVRGHYREMKEGVVEGFQWIDTPDCGCQLGTHCRYTACPRQSNWRSQA